MNNQPNSGTDLIIILKKIYDSRKLIIYISLIFAIIGAIYSLILPIKYTSSIIFITQNQESSNSSLSGVANLVGINIGSNSGNDIQTSMYPKIAESTNFRRLLLESIIDKKTNKSLKSFLIDFHKLDGENEKNNSKIFVSIFEQKLFDKLSKMIEITVNQKDGFITVVATAPVAEYSAILAQNTKSILQKIIINNKIERAKQNLKFSEEQLAEKKIEFDGIQTKLSYFSDSNLNSVSPFVINERDKLDAKFQIINAVVTELSKQVEQAKLQVNKDTPVFSTIKDAVVPILRTSPKRKEMVIKFILFGFVLGVLYSSIKDQLKSIITEIIK